MAIVVVMRYIVLRYIRAVNPGEMLFQEGLPTRHNRVVAFMRRRGILLLCLIPSCQPSTSSVSHELGQELFEAADGPKRFVSIAGSGHNDPWNGEFHEALDEFLAALPRPPYVAQVADSQASPLHGTMQ